MNQGAAFARTLRAVDADDFRGSKLALLLAVILLLAWTLWMLNARIPRYETSLGAALQASEVFATFDAPVMAAIHTGEPARVYFGGTESVPAEVAGISGQVVEIKLLAKYNRPLASRVIVQVEVERVSPATIALRAIGRGN